MHRYKYSVTGNSTIPTIKQHKWLRNYSRCNNFNPRKLVHRYSFCLQVQRNDIRQKSFAYNPTVLSLLFSYIPRTLYSNPPRRYASYTTLHLPVYIPAYIYKLYRTHYAVPVPRRKTVSWRETFRRRIWPCRSKCVCMGWPIWVQSVSILRSISKSASGIDWNRVERTCWLTHTLSI